MRYLTAFLLAPLLLWPLGPVGATDGKVVSLPLIVDPSRTANISYSFATERDGRITKGAIEAAMDIEKSVAGGFLAVWTSKLVSVSGNIPGQDGSNALNSLANVPVRFVANARGAPLAVEDKDDIITSIGNSALFKDLDQQMVERTLNLFRSMSEEAIAQTMFRVPSYMSICQGTALEIGVPLKQQYEMPSPMGRGTILTNITYELVSLDPAKKEAEITYHLAFDPDSVTAFVRQLLPTLLPGVKSEKRIAKEVKKMKMIRNDAAHCTVNTETGWVSAMTYSTDIAVSLKGQSISRKQQYDLAVDWHPK